MSAFYSFCVPQDVAMGSGRSGVLAIISENCYLEGTFRDKYFSEEVCILTLKLLMSYIYIYIYIYGAPILDVSRSHTTTQHSR